MTDKLTYQRGSSLRARLYWAIGSLLLMPICGIALIFAALHHLQSDNVALDRASRSAIYLERINALVYASVMESRGIYMSADWTQAEQFANNLTRNLNELSEVTKIWKEDATRLHAINVAELDQRLSQFIGVRRELIRIAKDRSIASARDYGDRDAPREFRTALNRSLTLLARTYEDEVKRSRTDAEADAQKSLMLVVTLAAVGVIVLGCSFFIVPRALLQPLLRMGDWMEKLAGGDLYRAIERQRYAAEIADMLNAIEIFRQNLIDRRRLARETALLTALNEWLQSCNSLDELYEMVGRFLGNLLPGCSGNLFVYANSRDVLEGVKVWNGAKVNETMRPDDCWGLRRGRTYAFGDGAFDLQCAHVAEPNPGPYCCIPILAHGDTIGLLHLKFSDATGAVLSIAEQRRLATACAEQISLAVANVRLRDQLREQSIRDPLTGLFNRRYLLETCRREFARAARASLSVGVLSIDVDHFKQYNDSHGHDAGDTVLRAVGGALDALFRAEDVACRFGGEEFVVILPGADMAVTGRRAEQLRSRIEALSLRYLEQDLPHITVSIGVATFPEAGSSPETVLRAADEALYRAKAGGRNRVEAATARAAGELPAIMPETGPQLSRLPLDEAADG